MTRYRIELSPEALEQADLAQSWWNENRPKAPGLFEKELSAALERLAFTPRTGKPYERSKVTGMRRLLMPRTRYHVYYTILEGESLVRVHTVWHASRRKLKL